MKHHLKHHLKHMAIGGGLILAVLLIFRVDFGTALSYALLAACPLGMVGMMFMMDRHSKAGHDDAASCHGPGPSVTAGGAEGGAANAANAGQPRTRENHERIQ